VAVEPAQQQRIDGDELEAARLERLGRQNQEGGPVRFEELGGRLGASRTGALLLTPAGIRQGRIQALPGVALGDRHEEVAADVADAVLHVPLLLWLTYPTEVRLEAEVRLQAEELGGQLALVGAGEFGHGDLAVVVADAARHATKEGEGAIMAAMETFGTFAR